MFKKSAVVVLCCASLSWAEFCWKKTPEGVRQEVSCNKSAQWTSDEKPSRHPEPAWQRGEVNALFLPVQTWDGKTGGTEISDKIKWAKAHTAKPPAPIQISSGIGKEP